jgi:hypothetical protein
VENPPIEERYMTRQRKTFDTSLKLEVVRMIKEQGLSVQNVSHQLQKEDAYFGERAHPFRSIAPTCA